MLMHHSAESYKTASKKAADYATKQLEQIIRQGAEKLGQVHQKMQDETPADIIAPVSKIRFQPKNQKLTMEVNRDLYGLHPHALNQVAERAGVPFPKKFVDWFSSQEDWGISDLSMVFNHAYSNQDARYLIRSVGTQTRGFLSDRYRRMDSGPMIDAFITAATAFGAVPSTSAATDTKFYMKFVLPHIFEPIPNEVMLFGLQLQNSDYADGALSLKGFVHRLRCTNLMLTEDGFRKVHIGARLGDDISYSQQTYDLDARAMASAVRDVVGEIFSPTYVDAKFEAIQEVASKEVDTDAVLKGLKRRNRVTVGEEKKIAEAFNSAEVERLPPGNTMWRLANAVSLVAQQATKDRELDLEQLAGELGGLVK
jgi:hypothetical protein